MPHEYKLEICLDSVESAIIAQEAGADRIELCDNLLEGGTTPSLGMVQLARKHLHIGLQVIIRPRGGDFCYSDLEFAVMQQDVMNAKEAGADGVVLGILHPDGTVDIKRTKELVDLARPMVVTFHRAFDMTKDPFQALEDIIVTGADRILTSGQKNSALEGMSLIKELVRIANDRISIMPGAGINENNIEFILQNTHAKEFHMSANMRIDSQMDFRSKHISMGGKTQTAEFEIRRSDFAKVKKIKTLLENIKQG